MANPEHLAILKRGVPQWNEWRESHDSRVDLSDTDLSKMNLREVNLERANLSNVNLSGADLNGAHLSNSNLFNANLSDVNLSGAILLFANLSNAHLSHANLSHANLSHADFTHADLIHSLFIRTNFTSTSLTAATFTDSIFGQTIFADVSLSGTIGLDTCRYDGPSYVDFHTLRQSWPLPLSFLRGCGLSDTYIEYIPSLFGQPVQFYSLFISYSTKDDAFARRLHADLQEAGVRCWFAPHDMAGGKKTHEQIDQAIRLHERLLLILSPDSMKSAWVETEISKARRREYKEKRQVLFPVRLCSFDALRDWECFDADSGKDSAREIREYFIPDFSEWKDHDSYAEAFDRLLRDLKKADQVAK